MGRKLPGMIVVVSQLLLVSVFFVSIFSEEITVERYVSTIHNDNLNKIANSVSLLLALFISFMVNFSFDIYCEKHAKKKTVMEFIT